MSNSNSPADLADQIQQQTKANSERLSFLNSEDGIRAYLAEAEKLFTIANRHSKEIQDKGIHFAVKKLKDGFIIIHNGYSITFVPSQSYANTLDGSKLTVRSWYYVWQENMSPSPFDDSSYKSNDYFVFERSVSGDSGWIPSNQGGWNKEHRPSKFYSSEELMDKYIRQLLTLAKDNPGKHYR